MYIHDIYICIYIYICMYVLQKNQISCMCLGDRSSFVDFVFLGLLWLVFGGARSSFGCHELLWAILGVVRQSFWSALPTCAPKWKPMKDRPHFLTNRVEGATLGSRWGLSYGWSYIYIVCIYSYPYIRYVIYIYIYIPPRTCRSVICSRPRRKGSHDTGIHYYCITW